MTVNIEYMWQGLERGKIRVLASLSNRFVPSHIHSIFTVSTPILYLSCNTICKEKNKKQIEQNKKQQYYLI